MDEGRVVVDDKPKNLREVAASPVRVVGFFGSGKYDTAAACNGSVRPLRERPRKYEDFWSYSHVGK